MRYAPFPLGLTTVLGKLLFSLVLRKFGSTSLFVFSELFWTDALRLAHKLTTSLSSSLCIIRVTAHTSCGWRCSTLKMAFHVLICSKLDYAAPAWQSWLSATNLSILYHLQNHSLWIITGQLVYSPSEALRLEADVQSYHTCSTR